MQLTSLIGFWFKTKGVIHLDELILNINWLVLLKIGESLRLLGSFQAAEVCGDLLSECHGDLWLRVLPSISSWQLLVATSTLGLHGIL